MFQNYNISQVEKVSIIKKKWPGRQGLQFLENLTQAEQEKCNNIESPFETLSNKFTPQHNKTIKFLQYCELNRQNSENVEEWIGGLRIAMIECNCEKQIGS